MNKNYLYFGAILDRSESMELNEKIREARNGFNNLIKENKEKSYKTDIYLTIFDNEIKNLYKGSIQDCPELNEKNFQARGMTSLYDAMGKTINEIGEILSKMDEKDRPGKVIIYITTDGEENNSTEFSAETLGEMIKKQQEVYSWEFVFMGASQESVLDAKKLNINSTFQYDNTAKGINVSYSNLRSYIDNSMT